MVQFYLPEIKKGKERVYLSGEEANHLTRVLRKKEGERVKVFNKKGEVFLTQIVKIEKGKVYLKVVKEFFPRSEPLLNLNLYIGCLKKAKMEWLIQKATELGVKKIVPLVTSRTIVKVSHRRKNQLLRWQKIALAAVKQSERLSIPEIFPLTEFKEAVERLEGGAFNLLLWEEEREKELKEHLSSLTKDFSEVNLFIGPEGGFSKEEVKFASQKGVEIFSLGERILRSETAALVGITLILAWGGEF